ncbi:histidine kinase [Pedobacter nyackensis]|uniref:sensor histidine kinase n=1 Tax=Pedobacter nyackensis TaxID=475255 RepID=UPI00292EFC72|nr:histidine kinase [Pedobacter nyackensis]
MIRARTFTIIIHVAAWLLFISFPIIFISQRHNFTNSFSAKYTWAYVEFCLFYVVIFYLNAYYLFPKLYFKKKYLLYGLSIVILLILVFTIKPFDQLIRFNRKTRDPAPRFKSQLQDEVKKTQLPATKHRYKGYFFDINSLLIFLMVIFIGIALRTIKEWQLTEKRAILAEAEKANAVLSFLKAQINPHFLYNTLNNIYTLCITGNEKAAESILRLSRIMRYVTDEAEADFVSLQGELDCIDDFIALQKIRLGKKVSLEYKVEGNAQGHQISPLILMTFIENVFKYGLSNHIETTIIIRIRIEAKLISFYAQNTIFESRNLNERKGLGISNTRQRLEHLYPGRHKLKIDDKNNRFTVSLLLVS